MSDADCTPGREPRSVAASFQPIVAFITSPWERLQNFVINASVCASVCLPACLSVCPTGTTCVIFTNFFVHVAHVRGLVLFRYVDDRPHCLSLGRGWRQCTVRLKCSLQLPCWLRFCSTNVQFDIWPQCESSLLFVVGLLHAQRCIWTAWRFYYVTRN